LLAALVLTASSLGFAAQTSRDGAVHEFLFIAKQPVHQVDLAGTFNNWSQTANPLQPSPDGRTWTLRLKLPYGRVQYKFVVDGSEWTLDPSAPAVPDGQGHTNSVVLVAPPDYDRPASPTDGVIAASALRHEPAVPDLNYDRGRLRFQLRARPDDLAAVYLRVNGKRLPMSVVKRDDLYETYRVSIPWDRNSDLNYEFELHDGSTTAIFSRNGLTPETLSPRGRGQGEGTHPSRQGGPTAAEEAPTAAPKPEPFHIDAKTYRPFQVPTWVENSVIYQIFPDRFANGDKSNDPPDVQPWGAKPAYYNFFGGDVAGVSQHLGYLKDLGIGAVYFNPVFKGPSNHRYETTDYLQIDPRFGTNKEFSDLTHRMRADGIRTVLDFAFNHTATDFFAFKDVLEKGKDSPYTDWYFIRSYPVKVKENPPYVAWYGFPSMPKLNVMNPGAHAYILNAVDFWKHNSDLAGIRLDVASEVDSRLWRDMRAHVKAYSPDTWIIGEEWGDAGPWLSGDQWDSTMDYQFRDACVHFFAEGSTRPSEFMGRLQAIYDSYVPQVSRNLMNLIDSHDTPRFLTVCKGNRDLLLLAATVEFTWPGAPTIYYGDELGMTGDRDPDNRRCMEWNRATPDNAILAYYKRLVHIRNTVPALRTGEPQILLTDDRNGTFSYARTLDNRSAIVAVNASTEAKTLTIPLSTLHISSGPSTPLVDLISGLRAFVSGRTVSLRLPARRAAVLVPASNSTSLGEKKGFSRLRNSEAKIVRRNSCEGGRNPSSSSPVGTFLADRSVLYGHRSQSHSQGATE
jgi:glycosidase